MAGNRAATGALPLLKDAQARASAPDRHVWLAASAGTGKTQVLAARVYRLLLRGVDPSAILCLTFTKAGAAEMAGRINGRLAAWVRMPAAELRKDLLALGEDAQDDALLARARTLFAKVLDAPGGGLRIQTIHGFCQALLAAFPLEAGLVPGFRPLEGREEAILARDTLAALLVDAEREGRAAPVATLGALSIRLGEGGAEEFLRACTRAGEALDALPSVIGPWLRARLALPDGPIEAHLQAACGDDAFDRAALEAVAAMNRDWGTKGGVGRAEAIGTWLALAAEERSAGLEALHLVWAKADGDIRSFGKGQAPTDPRYADLATRLHGRCAELLSLRVRAAYADLLADALTVGRDYADAYARAKRRAGAVDFDDLIAATVRLLAEPGMGDWVRYKLDLAIDHVLIDEAQDTNLAQWRIVGALAGEFFAGQGARGDRMRTLFTVGDYKQAIFGFQGTDPLFFAAAEKHFERLATDGTDYPAEAAPWTRLSLTRSFRSTRPILEFVDVAVDQMPLPGMGAAAPAERHASEVPGPGAIELWPPVIAGGGSEGEGDEEGWVDDATRALATRIARQVRGWLDGGLTLGSRGRPLRPEDVMILVKRRGELASLLVARLYAEGVPVAGVDRLRLNGPLAVQDLLAAVRFALQPEDDLSLACLLVSPLLGWTQDDLMAAAPRERGSLWRHLVQNEPPERLEPLRAMLARVDLTTPYQFLEELLSGPTGGRRSLLRRLGREARDPIDELLAAALEFETTTAPSLQRFLDWFDRGEVEVVRDPSAPLDAVRVMTAHGAKGLQAPLVILADACVDPTLSPRSTLRWSPEEGAGPVPVIRPRSAERGGPLDDVVADADRRELEEHWRLFYVAATRAEERLVVAGSLGPRAKGVPPAQSWYAAAARAMDALEVPANDGTRLFVGTDPPPPVRARAAARAAPLAPAPLPDWASRPAPQEARPSRPLAPSALGADEVTDPPPGPGMRAAAERGRLLHGLFERLPDVPVAARVAAADRWLAGQGVGDTAERDALSRAVLGIIDDPRFADLFGPGSLGEAPIAAVVADGVVVSGTVDRLLVAADRIRVVDFKTGRRAPAGLADVPAYHLRQLAAYAAALDVIFPGRTVEAALLYTAGPLLIELPAAVLAANKPGLPPVEQRLGIGG